MCWTEAGGEREGGPNHRHRAPASVPADDVRNRHRPLGQHRNRRILSDPPQLVADRTEVRIPAERIRSVERATWTIDRVVEPGGIIVITHSLGADVDTCLRIIGDDREAFDALSGLVRTRTQPTGEGTTS